MMAGSGDLLLKRRLQNRDDSEPLLVRFELTTSSMPFPKHAFTRRGCKPS